MSNTMQGQAVAERNSIEGYIHARSAGTRKEPAKVPSDLLAVTHQRVGVRLSESMPLGLIQGRTRSHVFENKGLDAHARSGVIYYRDCGARAFVLRIERNLLRFVRRLNAAPV